MKLSQLIGIFIVILFASSAYSVENHFNVTKKELPNQLGTFRQIDFQLPDHQTGTIYVGLLNQNYRARLYLNESSIQFFANYLDELSKHQDFIIGINGGYYRPNFTPAGLFIYQGKTIKPLVKNSLFKACIVINKNNKIVLETHLDQCVHAENAMQAGPLLIENGKVNNNLQRIKEKSITLGDFFDQHKRTLLALSDKNQLLMITTSQLALIDLANLLQNHPDILGVSKIKIAVNLDGGSSTGMYVRFSDAPFYFHEYKHVKTFIFIN